MPAEYPCPDLVVIQAVLHHIEKITDTLQHAERLRQILAALHKSRQRYAASQADIDQHRVYLLDSILAIIDPSQRTTQPYILTCGESSPYRLIAGRIDISGKLLIGEPMPPSGADCRDFPDKCIDTKELIVPIGILTTKRTALFEAQQYLPIGCVDADTLRDMGGT